MHTSGGPFARNCLTATDTIIIYRTWFQLLPLIFLVLPANDDLVADRIFNAAVNIDCYHTARILNLGGDLLVGQTLGGKRRKGTSECKQ